MQKNFLKYIWQHSSPYQIWMSVVILLSMPFYFFSLELPKRIINGPIQGDASQPAGGVQRFMPIEVPFAEWLTGQPIVLFEGFELPRLGMLAALCGVLLVLVMLNGWFKLYINTFKGKTSERVLRRMRYEMFDRVLRFPAPEARRIKAAEVSGIIKDEVEPLADFIGESYSGPLFLSGQAITGLTFLFLQNMWFGVLTLVIVSIQFLVIPMLRRRLIELGRQRQISARSMAGRIGEVLQGMDDVHLNDTSNHARAELTHRLGEIYFIRLELFKRKFSVKFLNNLLMQILAMLFYLIGGYFVIIGQMDIGALVASIAAYKDLPGPISGLINWDQQRQMAQVRFMHAIETFLRDDLTPAELQRIDGGDTHVEEGFETKALTYRTEGSPPALEAISTSLAPGETVAVISSPPNGAAVLLEILGRLAEPTSGRVLLDGRDLTALPEAFTGRVIGYADGSTYLPGGPIRDIFLEVLKNRPLRPGPEKADVRGTPAARALEAKRTANAPFDFLADWIDFERVGAGSEADLLDHIRAVARWSGLHDDICEIGMNSRLAPDGAEAIGAGMVAARALLRDKLSASGLESYVEPFDRDRYHMQSSVAENILFGMPVDATFAPRALADNPVVEDLLQSTGAKKDLLSLGLEIAQTFSEMLGVNATDTTLFETVTGMTPERGERLRAVIARVTQAGLNAASPTDQSELLALAMNYVEPRDRFGFMNEALAAKILGMRHKLRQRLEGLDPAPVAFYNAERYSPSLTISENILFGRIATNLVGGRVRIGDAVREVLTELDLWEPVFQAGLAFDIGSGGRGLSEGQRQKMRLARALMKKPDMLILNHACSSLPASEQRAILAAVLENAETTSGARPGIICAPADPAHADLFGRVLQLDHGRLDDAASSRGTDEAARREAANDVSEPAAAAIAPTGNRGFSDDIS